MTTKWLNAFALVLAAVAVGLVGFKNYRGEQEGQLLNVSYDPTREVRHCHPTGDGLRTDRRGRSAVRSLFSHRGRAGGFHLRFIVSSDQRADERHLAGRFQ